MQATYTLCLCCVAVEEWGAPMSVELEKCAGGVGFTLEGGKGSIHGDRPLVINRIFTGALTKLAVFTKTLSQVFLSKFIFGEKTEFDSKKEEQ